MCCFLGNHRQQTEHVEFNLQSATVETLEEAHQREQAAGGDEKASCPRRKHAFRLVTTTPTTPAAEGMRCSSPSLSASLMHCGAQGSTGGDSRHTRSKTLPGDVASASAAKSAAAGERGGDGDGEARESRSGSLSSARSPSIGGRASPEESGCVGKVSRQVWVLAATNSKVSRKGKERRSRSLLVAAGQEMSCVDVRGGVRVRDASGLSPVFDRSDATLSNCWPRLRDGCSRVVWRRLFPKGVSVDQRGHLSPRHHSTRAMLISGSLFSPR